MNRSFFIASIFLIGSLYAQTNCSKTVSEEIGAVQHALTAHITILDHIIATSSIEANQQLLEHQRHLVHMYIQKLEVIKTNIETSHESQESFSLIMGYLVSMWYSISFARECKNVIISLKTESALSVKYGFLLAYKLLQTALFGAIAQSNIKVIAPSLCKSSPEYAVRIAQGLALVGLAGYALYAFYL